MPNATVPVDARGLSALVSIRQAAALFDALQCIEETMFAHSQRDEFSSDEVEGEFNAAGVFLDDLRITVSNLAQSVLEKIRADKPADHHGEYRREVLLAQFEVENDPSLRAAVVALMRAMRPGTV